MMTVISASTLMTLVWFVSRSILISRFSVAERQQATEALRRSQALLQNIADRLDLNVQDYSNWDGMYDYIATRNADFYRENLDPSTLANLHLDARLVYDPQGTLICSQSTPPEGFKPGEQSPASPALITSLESTSVFRSLIGGTPMNGLQTIDGHLHFMVGRPILPNDGKGTPRGAIVFVRKLGDSDISDLRTLAAVEAAIVRDDASDPNRSPEVVTINDRVIESSIGFVDLSGHRFRLSVQQPRTIMEQGRGSLSSIAVSLCLATLIFSLVISLLIEQTLTKRVTRLFRDVTAIKPGDQLPSGAHTAWGDELALLAGGINDTFIALNHARSEIAEREHRFRTMAECAPLGVFVANRERGCSYVNAAIRTILDADRISDMHRDVASLISEDERPDLLAAWRHSIETGRPLGGRFKLGGMQRWISIHAAPMAGALASSGFVGTIEDVTDRILAEESLRDARAAAESANIAKSQFLANMSHELRTPMTAILGFADLLADPTESEASRRDHVTTIRRNAQHLLNIINDLLDVSKIEAGRMTVESLECAPVELIASVGSLMRAVAAAKKLPLSIVFDGPMPATIRTDPTRFRQILLNLVGNAVKFTTNGSVTIRVRVDRDGPDIASSMSIAVIDTGIGISPDAIDRLFCPFSQADTSMARRFGGTGLGLAISKRLATMLGGDIEVVSEEGKGSTFTFTLLTGPLSRATWINPPNEALLTGGVDAVPVVSKVSANVLLAEDGPDNQRLISFHLRKAGMTVTAVENGQLAFEAAQAALANGTPFNLILMDMQMPILDGYGATRALRAAGYRRPIIALTAHAMAEDRQRCIDAGCDAYLTKPIDARKLIAECDNWSRKGLGWVHPEAA